MEAAVLEALQEIGHATTSDVIRAGIQDSRCRALVVQLAQEIHGLGETEEQITHGDDLDVLAIELASLLSELNCPFTSLTSGSVADRFYSAQGSLQLIDYLTAELMALQMYHCNKKAQQQVIELQDTPVATALKEMTGALAMGEAPANLDTSALFARLNARIDDVLKRAGKDRLGRPLLDVSKKWSDKQWMDLEKRHAELDQEYDLRRQMLLTRLDCTVQAFNWSERMKPKRGQILDTYRSKLASLEKQVKGGHNTDIVALLAARDSLLAMEKASSAAVLKNTKSKIQRHIIGSVPDRGGRAWEHAPPPPEMPAWKKQRATGGPDAHRGGGGGGFGGGNRGTGGRGGRGGHGGNSNNRGGGGGGGAGHFQQRNDNQQQYGNYDQNRGSGQRVQSGWSQRGGGGGGGGGQHGYRGGGRGGRGGGRGNSHYQGDRPY